jgi:hypothetical protein
MDSTVRLPGFKCSICHHENLMRVWGGKPAAQR